MSPLPRPLRVLESVGEIKPTTNPYLALLIGSLSDRADTEILFFSFARALFARYDVFHVHWPEVLFGGHRASGRLVRRTLTSLVLIRLSLTRTPIVRTWHNTERPTGLSRWDHRLLDGFDRRTRVRIRLNDVTALPTDVPIVTVPLGHYRDWYRGRPHSRRVEHRVAYVGLIRRYKGVEDLVRAFRDARSPGATLHVSGKASTRELEATIRELAEGDPRVQLQFDFLDDDAFVAEVTAASIVVLPFVHMHNSSTVITALSLGVPVLAPDNEVNRELAMEFGDGWMHLYDGTITAESIDAALTAVAAGPPATPPDFTRRTWAVAAELHHVAFLLAREHRRD